MGCNFIYVNTHVDIYMGWLFFVVYTIASAMIPKGSQYECTFGWVRKKLTAGGK